MPYKLAEQGGRFCVLKDDETGEVVDCHDTKAEAEAQLAALAIATEDEKKSMMIAGSMEAFQCEMREAIAKLGLFNGGFDIVATMQDSVIICVWNGGPEPQHFSIAYTTGDQGIMLGAIQPVELETLVMPAETVEEPLPALVEENLPEMAPAESSMDGEYDMMAETKGGASGMEFKSFDIKADSEATTVNGVKGWTFDGYATVWDVEDAERDVTRKGAFLRTLAEGYPLVKYEHGPTVGVVLDAKEDNHGLYVKGFIPEDQATEFMRKLMKLGAVAKMSYGWKPYPGGTKRGPDGVRELTDIKLYEVSPVAIPMLDATSITSVKALPNGLPDAPFEVQMAAAGTALLAAKNEAEALMRRRERRRDGQVEWPISEKCAGAIAELGAAAGETFTACLQAEVKAGRAISGTRKRHLAALVRAAQAFVESLPEDERGELAGLLEDSPDAGDGKDKSAANAIETSAASREAKARDLVADYLESQLSRMTGNGGNRGQSA